MNPDEANASPSEPRETIPTKIIGWVGFFVVGLIWFGYWSWQAPSNADSSFDRLNTLFSGLAFWGLVFAILLQKKELELQRHELSRTREQIQGQKEQLESQSLTLKQQRFENTFFSLLDLFNGIVNSIEITRSRTHGDTPDVMAKGRECFTKFASELGKCYADMRKTHNTPEARLLCPKTYEVFSASRQSLVGHYFRTLYNIVKFIDTSDISDKQTYMNILRAQLSSSELTLLFYNCLSDYSSEKFKFLVEKYGLLENMDPSTLLIPEHRQLFDESAFHGPS